MSSPTTAPATGNPYVTGLLLGGLVALIAAIVLAVASNAALADAGSIFGSSSDLESARTLGAWADIAGLVGIAAVIGALVILGVRWQPRPAVIAPPREPEEGQSTHWLDTPR